MIGSFHSHINLSHLLSCFRTCQYNKVVIYERERDRDRLGSTTPGKTPQEGGRGVFAKGTKQARTASVYYHLSFCNSLLNAVPTKHFNMCSLHLHEYPLSPPLLPYLLSHSNTPFTFPLSLFFTVVAQLPPAKSTRGIYLAPTKLVCELCSLWSAMFGLCWVHVV